MDEKENHNGQTNPSDDSSKHTQSEDQIKWEQSGTSSNPPVANPSGSNENTHPIDPLSESVGAVLENEGNTPIKSSDDAQHGTDDASSLEKRTTIPEQENIEATYPVYERGSTKKVLKGYMKVSTGMMILAAIVFVNVLFIWKVTNDDGVASPTSENADDLTRVYATYEYILENYYKDVNQEALVDGAINGMIGTLEDPYSTYMSPDEAASFTETISGSFEGIGAEIESRDGKITIVSPIKGSPAEKAGLKPDDIIVSADGVALEGKSTQEAIKLIKGEKGTTVDLVIERPGQTDPISVSIVRDTIPVKTVNSEMLEDGVGRISISSFSQNTAVEFKENYDEMIDKGMTSLVLDLRGNPGGILGVAEDIANMFVPDGKIIVQTEYDNGKKEPFYADDNDGFKIDTPTVVLVDKGSASASEIVTGALQESAGIKVVGETTYGKGTIQKTAPMGDQSELKLTVGKWLTPDGNWVHEKGITPDVEVALPDYANLGYISPETRLENGANSAEVLNAEKVLAALGYNPGTIDTVYDDATAQAVAALEKANGIPETGVITGTTATTMMKLLHDQVLANDTQLDAAVQELK